MTDRETLTAYAGRAEDYIALGVSETQATAIAAFLSSLPKGAHILDLGCGPGLHAAIMQNAGYRLSAIDPTPEFVDAAIARGINARLGSFEDLTETAAYDAIWASFSLLHAPRADFPRHLAAIATALTPGGRLFLGMKLGAGEHRDDIGRFYSYYSETELRAVLDALGFTIEATETGAERGLAGRVDPYILIHAHA